MSIPNGHPAYHLQHPAGEALPIVVDSPHSGREMPADFRSRLPLHRLRDAEDTHVDRLWSVAPAHGAVLLTARFPRVYIDPNRALDDIDPLLLAEPWPAPVQAGPKSQLGMGLVWRLLDGEALYAGPLSVQQVQQRIDRCWRPYHAALGQALDSALQRHGARWHLNVHSMPEDSYRRMGMPERRLADVVLGDRDGSTADDATMAVLEASLRASGFTVTRNDPFKGVQIVQASGNPARRCHAVQIELKKSLYMDERTHQPHDGFAGVQAAIAKLMEALAAHVRDELR